MAETMNMLEITIEQFVNIIREKLEDEDYDPVMGIGKSGVGKTMSIDELTKELGIGYREMRLITMNEIDVLGMPEKDEYGATTYAANTMLPRADRDGEAGILVLDEITSCSSTLRAAAYQLLDSKRALGNYKLPEKWLVVCLGNGIDDGGVFNNMESALISRCTAYRIEPNVESWKKWALNHGVNKSVVAFISQNPNYMHVMDPDQIASVFPCPRSWVALSKKLNAREARKGGLLDNDKVELYAAGAIGASLAPDFATFYAFNHQLVDPETILNGTADASIVQDLGSEVRFLLIESLMQKVQEMLKNKTGDEDFNGESLSRLANIVNFFIASYNVSKDFSTQGMTDLTRIKEVADAILCSEELDTLCPNLVDYCSDTGLTIGLSDI